MTRINTANITALPPINELRRLMQSLAVLDAILEPKWEFRYYSFNAGWAEGEAMGSMRNGSGDELFTHFTSAGCFIKGFDHELAARFPPAERFYSQVPDVFRASMIEPAFSPDDVTFCCWRLAAEDRWHRAPADELAWREDGSTALFARFDADPETYRSFALGYFEKDIDPSAVAAVYNHVPLTSELAKSLNADGLWLELLTEAREIGYPLS